MKAIEISAKTIDKAIELGLKQLNTTLENVDIKIITEGGLFKKAKIEITLNPMDSNNEKEVKKQVNKLKELDEELVLNVKDIFKKPAPEKEIAVKNSLTKTENNKQEKTESENIENKNNNKVEDKEIIAFVEKFLNGLVYAYNINASVSIEARNKDLYAKVNGENLGVLIGYHGEAIDAIQFLLNSLVLNKLNSHKRIFLDVEGYREKRENTLLELSDKIVKRVLESKKSYKLDAMNSYERRLVHTHLQEIKNITTHSEGEEPNRHLIIDYKEY